MRFTSVFIPTLLSTSTVLAAVLEPYAGYKRQVDGEPDDENAEFEPYAGYKTQIVGQPGRTFSHVSAFVTIPNIRTRYCSVERSEVGFIVVAIGDPRTEACQSGSQFGLEAGTMLECSLGSGTQFTAYTQMHPLHGTDYPQIRFNVGDEVKIELDIRRGNNVYARFFNLTKRLPAPWREVGVSSGISEACLATAIWALRASAMPRVRIRSLPSFDDIYFSSILAVNDLGKNVGYTVPKYAGSRDRLVMRDPVTGLELAAPFHINEDDKSFQVFD